MCEITCNVSVVIRMPDDQLLSILRRTIRGKALSRWPEEIATKAPSDFDIPIGIGNRLHRSDQSGEVSSTKEQLSMKKM